MQLLHARAGTLGLITLYPRVPAGIRRVTRVTEAMSVTSLFTSRPCDSEHVLWMTGSHFVSVILICVAVVSPASHAYVGESHLLTMRTHYLEFLLNVVHTRPIRRVP